MDGTLIGYARCSTCGQDLRAHEHELRKAEAAPERIYTDTDSGFTGRNTNRLGLKTALEVVRGGDTLVVTKLDRLDRSIRSRRSSRRDRYSLQNGACNTSDPGRDRGDSGRDHVPGT